MIFNSVIAMKSVYCEDLQNITQRSLNNISNEKCLKNETINILSNIEVSNEFNSNQPLNMSNIKHQEMIDVQNDVIYDNLIIRYTYVSLQFSF